MNAIQLNELATEVHQLHIKWWMDVLTGQPQKRNQSELLMLMITEVAECCEGSRKDLMDDKLPHRKMEEVEMADTYIRVLDFAGGLQLKLLWIDTNSFDHLENKAECMLILCRKISEWKFRDLSTPMSVILGMIREYCVKFEWDLDGAVREKLEFNRTRADHTLEQRRQAGGKKF